MSIEGVLGWYQQRIGLYDKQAWETTVEQHILRGLSYTPRKTAKLKKDLIDVDLVRGSTFPKGKPQSDVWLAALHGVFRLLLLPLYTSWWIKETSYTSFIIIGSIYCSVITSCVMFAQFHDEDTIKNIPASEVILPIGLLLLLSAIHSQIACTCRSSSRFGSHSKETKLPKSENKWTNLNDSFFSKSKEENNQRIPIENLKNWLLFRHKYEPEKIKILQKSLSESEIYSSRIQKCDSEISNKNFNQTIERKESDKHRFNSYSKKCKRDVKYNLFSDRHGGKLSLSMRKKLRLNNASHMGKVHHVCSSGNKLRHRKNVSANSKSDSGVVEDSSIYRRVSTPHSDDDSFESDKESPISETEEVKESQCDSCTQISSSGFEFKYSHPRSYRSRTPHVVEDGYNSSCESDDDSNRPRRRHDRSYVDWGLSNNEGGNYSTESEGCWEDPSLREPMEWHIQGAPAAIITSTDRVENKVSCKMWENNEMVKVYLSVLDVSSAVISRVDAQTHTSSYMLFGLIMSFLVSIVPSLYRLATNLSDISISDNSFCLWLCTILLGDQFWSGAVICLNILNRFVLAASLFFLLSVAERTLKLRFLYAKNFSYLTSARRARKYDLPHFRLNKVINIKSWLSIRSCLKKRGPQHSVDVIVSATFMCTIILVCYLGVEMLKDEEKSVAGLTVYELFVWCFAVSMYLIRFMTLAALINKKYSNPSVLITEQINMYLHMEQKPHKKDELLLANNVLKLVSILLKELDKPFKISGLSANTLLYNITKFVTLSACSGVLSSMLGFKLKLYNMKFQ